MGGDKVVFDEKPTLWPGLWVVTASVISLAKIDFSSARNQRGLPMDQLASDLGWFSKVAALQQAMPSIQ